MSLCGCATLSAPRLLLQEQVKHRKKPGPKSKKQKEAEAAAAAAAQADFIEDGEPSQQDFAGGGTELI